MLKELSLANLKDTKLLPLYNNEMAKVLQSVIFENDIPGKRKISIDITVDLDGGSVIITFDCEAKVPKRSSKAIAVIEDEKIKIETTSDNAKQPGFEFTDSDKVRSITTAHREGAAS
ncbi:MAG: hypothetical protein C4586_08550 [Anaerolineaceae bacterium]|nr:MAG: hypothetical protein C4586_08550 [Anaerolineaceae bacterium]